MLSRRIDITTMLDKEELEKLERLVPDGFFTTSLPGYLIPPSRILLRPPTDEAREEAERIRYKYVVIAFEPDTRKDAMLAMRCPYIDAISFPLSKAYMIDKGLVHVARINRKYIELRFDEFDPHEATRALMKARHRLSVTYVGIYFGSGARKASEWIDPYAMAGFIRHVIKYDIFHRSRGNQRELLRRNRDRLEGYEIAQGVRLSKKMQNDRDKHGRTRAGSFEGH